MQLVQTKNDEGDAGQQALMDVVMHGSMTFDALLSYIDLVLGSQYGPQSERMFSSINPGIFLYNDVGLMKEAPNKCPDSKRKDVKELFTKHKILFWVLCIPGQKCNHWILAVIYPTYRKIALIDSCYDPKIHISVEDVR
jgi:hypothetical protein